MKTLHLEMNAGVCSDMLVGALLDLGADEAPIAKALAGFKENGIADVSYKVSRVNKGGVDACDFKVTVKGDQAQAYRQLTDVHEIIKSLEMSDIARRIVIRIYDILAGAEGTIYEEEPNQLYFHETASIEKMADIVAFACCFDSVIVGDVYVSGVTEGKGHVSVGNKVLNIPVPEVKSIAEFYNIPLNIADIDGELITPSGIAMVVAITTRVGLPEGFKVVAKGVGSGKLDFDLPAVLTINEIEK